MANRAALVILACIALGAVSPFVASAPAKMSPRMAEVMGLFDTWNRMAATGNPDRVAALYDADAVLLPTLDTIAKGRTAIRGYFYNFLKKQPVATFTDSTVKFFGANVATRSGTWDVFLGASNTTVKARLSITYVRNAQSQWMIEEMHSSLLPCSCTNTCPP